MAAGFFDLSETQIVRGDELQKAKPAATLRTLSCSSCGGFTKCHTPKFPVYGSGKNQVMIVLDYPGAEDDALSKVLSGGSGFFFRAILKDQRLNLADFWVTYGIQCRPDGSPDATMVAACGLRIRKRIQELKPKAVLVLGDAAMRSLFTAKGRISGVMEMDWQGNLIPDQELGTWLVPTWSLLELCIQKKDDTVKNQLVAAIHAAIKKAADPFPQFSWKDKIQVLTQLEDIIPLLRRLSCYLGPLAFDYETTGLKPYREGHRIVSASISDGTNSWAFPFSDHPEFLELWKKILLSENIPKIAHNGKFEALWTLGKLGYIFEPFHFDTMLAAHSLHNKKKTNLKFLTYCYFGIAGYDSSMDHFLQSMDFEKETHGGNAFNSIDQAPLDELLFYNGADSLFTFWLYKAQQKQIGPLMEQGIKFFTNASMKLAIAENNGICMDVTLADSEAMRLDSEMKKIAADLKKNPDLKKWNKADPFRMSASEDLSHFVFNILKKKPLKFTAGGKPKSDKAEMENHDHPVVTSTLAWRKLQKIKDTYLAQFAREGTAGIIHPFFNLGRVDTFRSSSDSPNFQNVPKRDPIASKPIRTLLRPHPGQMLCEYDYKAVEVAVSACYNKDPALIKYITDPTTDMHRDMGMQLFMKSKTELTKDDRSVAKNAFVFPAFYGSYYAQIAPNLWNNMPPLTQDHLRSQGVGGLDDFTQHVREVESDFWKNRFGVYAEWKESQYKFYLKKGYVESFTGFRYYGPMKKNEVINYPIQGSAFHIQLRTFGKMTDIMQAKKMRSKMMGQIHDSMVPSVDPAEEKVFDKLIWYYGTQEVREAWDWIIVPLSLEKSKSAIDGNWAEMKDCGLLQANGVNEK